MTELVCRPGSLLPQFDGVAEAAAAISGKGSRSCRRVVVSCDDAKSRTTPTTV